VADNASPDQVFWDEMERQRMQNQIVSVSGSGNSNGNAMDPVAAIGASSTGSSSSSAWSQVTYLWQDEHPEDNYYSPPADGNQNMFNCCKFECNCK
jgi:hypothetical protein